MHENERAPIPCGVDAPGTLHKCCNEQGHDGPHVWFSVSGRANHWAVWLYEEGDTQALAHFDLGGSRAPSTEDICALYLYFSALAQIRRADEKAAGTDAGEAPQDPDQGGPRSGRNE